MNDRLLSLLGLCRRARRLSIGAEVCVESVQSGKAALILYASDFSKNSLKPVLTAAKDKNVTILPVNRTKDELSFALGRLCGVLAVEDKGFAEKLVGMLAYEQGGELHD